MCSIWSSDAVTARQSICVWALFFCWLGSKVHTHTQIHYYTLLYIHRTKNPRWGLTVDGVSMCGVRCCGLRSIFQKDNNIALWGVSFISFVCFAEAHSQSEGNSRKCVETEIYLFCAWQILFHAEFHSLGVEISKLLHCGAWFGVAT